MIIFSLAFSFIKLLMTFPVLIEGGSMLPTFSEGEMVYMGGYEARFEGVERGDVVVFGLGKSDSGGVVGGEANVLGGVSDEYLFIKRVIGVPGDRVVIRDGGVEVNGKMLSEPYSRGETKIDSFENPIMSADAQGIVYNVPAGKYFVLGDNREASVDSRNFVGTYVDGAEVCGKLVVGVWR
jgi:signal peptidase I